MRYSDDMIARRVPKAVRSRTRENMEVYDMDLYGAFDDAARVYATEGTELSRAWYASDYRRFIPTVYEARSLDFKKYPLRYWRGGMTR